MQNYAANRLRIACVGGLLSAVLLYYANSPQTQHGLSATYFIDVDFKSTSETRVEAVAMANSNDKIIPNNAPFSIRWEGYLWTHKDRETQFTIPTGVAVNLILDGEQIIHSNGTMAQEQTTTSPLTLDNGLHALSLEIARAKSTEDFFSANLEWDTIFGQRLIPSSSLYPSAPTNAQAQIEFYRARMQSIAIWLAALTALGYIGVSIYPTLYSMQRRELWLLGLVFSIAICLRFVYLNNLIAQIPNFDALPIGSDHRTYESAARDFVRGLWPPPGEFYRQPGFPWLLGNFHSFFGPSIRLYQFIQLTSGAFASIAIFVIGKRIFGSASGWAASLLWATFPLAVFYDAQLVTHALEAQVVVWLLCIWLSAIDRPTISTLFGLGLLLGGAAAVRPALLALVPLVSISLVLTSGTKWRHGISRGLVLITIAALPILPITLHNYYNSGHFQLISANGPVTLYLGNNKDAAGIGQYSQAFRTTHERVNRGEVTFLEATVTDIQTEPVRWIGLMVRKTALYFGNLEIPNNVDFITQGLEVSKVLYHAPHRFGSIVVLGLTGFTIALKNKRVHKYGIWMIGTTLLVLYITTVAFHVVSRFRVPTYGPLIILSGSAIVEFGRVLARRDIRENSSFLAVITASIILVLAMPWVADNSVPKPITSALPDTSIEINTRFSNILELSGHDPFPAVEPNEPLNITLYWKALAPLAIDYYGTVQIFSPSGDKLTQADNRLGTGSFPHYPSSLWSSDEIITDKYLVFMPDETPSPVGLTVMVAVYNRETGERLGEQTLSSVPLTFQEPLELPESAIQVNAMIGPTSLRAYSAEITATELSITLFWELVQPATSDGVVFIHIFDNNGTFILGQDLPPSSGRYPMTLWQLGEGILDARRIQLDNLIKGDYDIFIGVYDPTSGLRFPIFDANGNPIPNSSLNLFRARFNGA